MISWLRLPLIDDGADSGYESQRVPATSRTEGMAWDGGMKAHRRPITVGRVSHLGGPDDDDLSGRAVNNSADGDPSPKAWMSWSSGKDSAIALHATRMAGAVDVVGLVTTVNSTADRVAMHAVRRFIARGSGRCVGFAAARGRTPVALSQRCLRGAHGHRVRRRESMRA